MAAERLCCGLGGPPAAHSCLTAGRAWLPQMLRDQLTRERVADARALISSGFLGLGVTSPAAWHGEGAWVVDPVAAASAAASDGTKEIAARPSPLPCRPG